MYPKNLKSGGRFSQGVYNGGELFLCVRRLFPGAPFIECGAVPFLQIFNVNHFIGEVDGEVEMRLKTVIPLITSLYMV